MSAALTSHKLFPAPPGLSTSDGESSTASRERRRVAVVAREVTSVLMDKFYQRMDTLDEKLDRVIASLANGPFHDELRHPLCSRVDRLETLLTIGSEMSPSVDEVLSEMLHRRTNASSEAEMEALSRREITFSQPEPEASPLKLADSYRCLRTEDEPRTCIEFDICSDQGDNNAESDGREEYALPLDARNRASDIIVGALTRSTTIKYNVDWGILNMLGPLLESEKTRKRFRETIQQQDSIKGEDEQGDEVEGFLFNGRRLGEPTRTGDQMKRKCLGCGVWAMTWDRRLGATEISCSCADYTTLEHMSIRNHVFWDTKNG